MKSYYAWHTELPARLDLETGNLSFLPNPGLGFASFDDCAYASITLPPPEQENLLARDLSDESPIFHWVNDNVCVVLEPLDNNGCELAGTVCICHKFDKEEHGDDYYRCPVCGGPDYQVFPNTSPPEEGKESDPRPDIDNESQTECPKCLYLGELMSFNTMTWDTVGDDLAAFLDEQ